jgi:mono/diheme cytochrome c family protein
MTRCISTPSAAVALIGIWLSGALSAATPAPVPAQRRGTTSAALPQKNPLPPTEASIKAGRAVYAKICRACHGLQGKGDGVSAPPGSKPANLVDTEWKYGGSDAEVFKTIKQGVKPFDVMEPWGKKLSDTDIWNTINFLRDLSKTVNKNVKK